MWLAVALSAVARVANNVSVLAHDSLLDAVVTLTLTDSNAPAPAGAAALAVVPVVPVCVPVCVHAVKARSYVTGYAGMCCFVLLVLAPVLSAVYFGLGYHNTLWVQGILPAALSGLWVLAFMSLVEGGLPPSLGEGPPLLLPGVDADALPTSKNADTVEGNDAAAIDTSPGNGIITAPVPAVSTLRMFAHTVRTGVCMHLENVKSLHELPDLRRFVVAVMLINSAANTAYSAAAIIIIQILKTNNSINAAIAVAGTVSAVVGVAFYKKLHYLEVLSSIGIMMSATLLLLTSMVLILYIERHAHLICLAALAGFQIGALGTYVKSNLTHLTPSSHQARIYSLLQVSLELFGFFGPVCVSAISDHFASSSQPTSAGEMDKQYLQVWVVVVAVEMVLALPLLCLVDVPRALSARDAVESAAKC